MHNSPLFYKWIPFKGSTKNPLVLLHGYLETHSIWYELPLSQLERPLLLIDIPGFGSSSIFDDDNPSISYFAREIAILLEREQVQSFHVVGHSMGGYVGLELLNLCPQLEKVILLNSNFWEDSIVKKKERARVADLLLKVKNSFIREAIPSLFVEPQKHRTTIQQLIKTAQEGVAEWYAYAALAMRERKDFTNELQQQPHRFEIIHGEKDKLITLTDLRDKCGTWKEFHVVDNAGHMALFEQPKAVIHKLQQLI